MLGMEQRRSLPQTCTLAGSAQVKMVLSASTGSCICVGVRVCVCVRVRVCLCMQVEETSMCTNACQVQAIV